MIDLSSYVEVMNSYLGSEKKKKILVDGRTFLVKFPDPVRERHKSISYVNNVYSEYLGCHIFSSVGISTQETYLGTYLQKDGREKIVCACLDFTSNDEKLYEFEKSVVSNIMIEKRSTTDIEDVLMNILTSDTIAEKEMIISFFFQMFIVDALIGNTDRHHSNWGFLKNEVNHSIRIAPVYDCGSSFLPLLTDKDMENLLADEKELKNKVLNIYSCLKENGKKILYQEYILSLKNELCNQALLSIFPKIDMEKILAIIEEMPIGEVRKKFYQKFLMIRYDEMIKRAYMALQNRV